MAVITIETMDDEGRGRVFFEGRDYAVRGAFPGDIVEFRLERNFKAHNLMVGKTRRYVKKGPHHVHRTCPGRGPCAACPLHDATPELENTVKRDRIVAALDKEGLSFEVDPVLPHPDRMGYRQKVKLMVSGFSGFLRLGVYVPYSHTFEDASQCPHVNPAINDAIARLIPVLNQSGVDTIRAVILRAGLDGVAGILVTTKPLPDFIFENSPLLSLKERVQPDETNSILGGTPGQSVGPEMIQSLEDGQMVDPDAFCQADPVQAQRLYELVADYLWQGSGHYVDAYAGVGGFAKALLKKGECKITAIESNAVCLSSLEALGVGTSPRPSPGTGEGGEPVLGLVLDPPKKGLMGDAEVYAGMGALRVVLVSCDPSSMVKDLKVLLKAGYEVERILPVDLFGATPAIETVVFLRQVN
ncbi:MAG: hypothetical protein V4534_04880 [Myxococcota bacterium]